MIVFADCLHDLVPCFRLHVILECTSSLENFCSLLNLNVFYFSGFDQEEATSEVGSEEVLDYYEDEDDDQTQLGDDIEEDDDDDDEDDEDHNGERRSSGISHRVTSSGHKMTGLEGVSSAGAYGRFPTSHADMKRKYLQSWQYHC